MGDREIQSLVQFMHNVELACCKEADKLEKNTYEKARYIETVGRFLRDELAIPAAIFHTIKHGDWSTVKEFCMTKVLRLQRCALKLCRVGVPRKYWGIVSSGIGNNDGALEPPEVDDKNYSRWKPEVGYVVFPVGGANYSAEMYFANMAWDTAVDCRNTDFIATLIRKSWDPDMVQRLKEKVQSV